MAKDTMKKWRRKAVLSVKTKDLEAVNAECVALGWSTAEIPFFTIKCNGCWIASCPVTDEMMEHIPKNVKVVKCELSREAKRGSRFVLEAADRAGIKVRQIDIALLRAPR